jgi:membrane protein implicated in regulation of membrane protease activity
MNVQLLLTWWNLIFVVPFLLALLYLVLYTLSGVDFGEADADGDFDGHVDAHADVDADADADVDADMDADADVDADVDADADADADADVDVDADADGHVDADADHDAVPAHLALMSFIGVGRVPLSLLLTVLLMTWGAAGFVVNQIAGPRLGVGPRLAVVSIPIAALASLGLTRLLASAIDRWLPLNETTARRRHELLGRSGEAIFPIGRQFGLAAVRDERGELYQVPCQLDPKLEGPIAKGAKVRLVAYSAKTRSFVVTPASATGHSLLAIGGSDPGPAPVASGK